MSWEPWLRAVEPKKTDTEPYDPDDRRLLINILKPKPGEPPPRQWVLDHLLDPVVSKTSTVKS